VISGEGIEEGKCGEEDEESASDGRDVDAWHHRGVMLWKWL